MATPASSLRNAASVGDIAVVRHLLAEAVDPNVADEHGRTALSHASGRGHTDVVVALLSAGAWVDPHEDYDPRETPLMMAALNGHLEIVQKLIAAGADHSFHAGVAQRTAESYARDHGHLKVAEYLSQLPRK